VAAGGDQAVTRLLGASRGMSGVESDIGRLYDIRECRPLTDDQLRPMLITPLARQGIPAEPAAIEALVDSANGSPQRLQQLGATAAGMARPPYGLDTDIAKAAIGQVNAQSAVLFEAAWNNSTDAEKDLLARAALAGPRGLSVPSVTQAVGPEKWAAVDAARQSLKARGLLRESEGSGRMRFANPGMQQWAELHVGTSAAHLGVALPGPVQQQSSAAQVAADQGARATVPITPVAARTPSPGDRSPGL
jgi:hypothetical protein